MPRRLGILAGALVLSLSLLAPAQGASRLTVRGAGWGHGVGLSQFGTLGYAKHGWTYDRILAHYYSHTALGQAEAGRQVRVLIASVRRSTAFSGADAAGEKTLNPDTTYSVRRKDSSQVELLSPKGHSLGTFPGAMEVTGPGPITLRGAGSYRGELRFQPGGFIGLDVINALGLEDYVRGVVSRESGASWPIEALKAQAVAARTYAVTTGRSGAFDQYADTRSQVYGGAGAETPTTDAAVSATAHELVTYEGTPVVTFFFSTSGGRTESVENSVLGKAPKPWLKSVDDPYDSISPRHRWVFRYTLAQAGRKLRGLVLGRFRGIKVLERGDSPRIVSAQIIGSRGRTLVDGPTLRTRLGLYDTWAYFSSVGIRETPPPDDGSSNQPPNQAAGDPTGGSSPGATSARVVRRPAIAGLGGRIVPARHGALVVVERLEQHRWGAVGSTAIHRGGAYRFGLSEPGVYRVRLGDTLSARVRIRPR